MSHRKEISKQCVVHILFSFPFVVTIGSIGYMKMWRQNGTYKSQFMHRTGINKLAQINKQGTIDLKQL